MQKLCSTVLVLVLSVGLCFGQEASNRVLFFPGRQSLVLNTYRDVQVVDKNKVVVSGLPGDVDPQTIQIHDLDCLYWSYRFDAAKKDQLLQKYIGSTISVLVNGRFEDVELVALDSSSSSTPMMMVRLGDQILSIGVDVPIRFPRMEGNTYSPTVTIALPWLSKDRIPVTLSYFVPSLTSEIQYRIILDEKYSQVELQPYVLINNNSTLPFMGMTVEVQVGDPHFLSKSSRDPMMLRSMAVASAEPSAQDDYFLFRLTDKADLKQGGMLALPLFKPKLIKCQKLYRFYPENSFLSKDKTGYAESILVFANTTGFPLPSGKAMLFSKQQVFLGEQFLASTSRNQDREIPYGKALDITGRKTQVDSKTVGKETTESYSITMSNYKAETVVVEVVDSVPADAEILSSSQPYDRVASTQIRSKLTVNPGQRTVFQYSLKRSRL
ncbi:MAG: DUF4139 domain-containing protein [Candidatus Margulisiibacteriota bacterium]